VTADVVLHRHVPVLVLLEPTVSAEDRAGALRREHDLAHAAVVLPERQPRCVDPESIEQSLCLTPGVVRADPVAVELDRRPEARQDDRRIRGLAADHVTDVLDLCVTSGAGNAPLIA